MIGHEDLSSPEFRKLVRQKKIGFGGNSNLKIYGTLRCKSGKRMKKENRVFFISEQEATGQGYRPCGNCMKSEYKKWIYLTAQ